MAADENGPHEAGPAGGHRRLAERAGVDDEERRARIAEVLAEIEGRGLHSVRLAFADPHGVLRGKTLRADLVADAFHDGLGITSALLLKDTGQVNVYPVWASGGGLERPWLTGAGDVLMLPDPTTFRVLPWLDGTGWLLCDVHAPTGEPVDLSTRRVCASAQRTLADRGLALRAGLEVEFHLYRITDQGQEHGDRGPGSVGPGVAPAIAHTHPGRVYLGENRFDLVEPFLEVLRRDLTALGLAPRSLEIELGPSQVELTFSPADGLEVADQAVLLRAAVRQIARRNGLHATFMGRPNLPHSFSSGWHLHQSLVDPATSRNLFTTTGTGGSAEAGGSLSELGCRHLAGLLDNAAASCLLTTPTVTGYKRYRPDSLAPFRAAWGAQHRGAMLRVIGGGDDPGTRIENRVGDSAANPYLYVTSQVLSGLAGIDGGLTPPPPSDSPYDAAAGPRLPGNLGEAVEAFATSDLYRSALGDEFVDYLAGIKRAEWNRFLATVTDWEQTEYLDLF